MATKKEWTVLFLAQVNTETDLQFFKPLLDEAKAVELTDEVVVIFCVNFKFQFCSVFLEPQNLQLQPVDEDKYTTCVFRLKAGNENRNELSLIDEIPNFDITSYEDIGDFINKIYNRYITDKHLLFTWDHGDGYSIFSGIENSKNTNLTMRELSKAIWSGFKGEKKMDVVAMSNCWMQLIDTHYALQNEVYYLVAPQDEVCLDLYDYTNFFNVLLRSPHISAESLGRAIVQSARVKERCVKRKYTISGVGLSEIGAFFQTLNILADGLRVAMNVDTERDQVNLPFIKKVKDQFLLSYRLNRGNRFVDVYSFLNNLLYVLEPQEAYICQKLINMYDSLIIEYKSNYSNSARNAWDRSHGISLYCPFTIPRPETKSVIEDYPKIPKDVKKTDFKKTRWGKLMKKLDAENYTTRG